MSNLMKLTIAKWSTDAIPEGGGIADGIKAIIKLAGGAPDLRKANQWCLDAIEAVRQAKDPNPYKTMSDEEIAAVILKEMDSK